MDPKQYLEQYERKRTQIEINNMELESARAELSELHVTLIDSDIERRKRKLARMLREYINQCSARIQEAVQTQHEIIKTINRVKCDKCKRLLIQKYVNGFTWEQIAEQFDCSYQYIAGDLKQKAYNLIAEILSD